MVSGDTVAGKIISHTVYQIFSSLYSAAPAVALRIDREYSILIINRAPLCVGPQSRSDTMECYLDNSATTRVLPQVADTVYKVLTQQYGNPSSLHKKGLEAELILEGARRDLAQVLGCDSSEVYFTSGGTEANNWAVYSGYELRRRRATGIVTTAFEHSSVIEPVQFLAEKGAQATFVVPDITGHIDPAAVLGAVDENTGLVSLMLVNNELGTILPIKALAAQIKRKNPQVLVHCDAVQGFGKLPLSVHSLGVDMLTVTGHKIHAPKGIGALYIKKGVHLKPIIRGGQQQKRLRPGTENVAYAAALAQAAQIADQGRVQNTAHATALRDKLLCLCAQNSEIVINSPADGLPYIVNLSVLGIRSETLLHFLAEQGIYVSSGSACAKGGPSHVLRSTGMDLARADSALRISFSAYTDEREIDCLYQGICQAQATLSRR